MSLKQKYTWHDFKQEQGDKVKDMKRTSPEGKKAFEAALKSKMKEVVKDRLASFKKQKQTAEKDIQTLQGSLKGLKAGNRKQAILNRISRKQQAITNFTKVMTRDESREL